VQQRLKQSNVMVFFVSCLAQPLHPSKYVAMMYMFCMCNSLQGGGLSRDELAYFRKAESALHRYQA
jgi:hypothetical protein